MPKSRWRACQNYNYHWRSGYSVEDYFAAPTRHKLPGTGLARSRHSQDQSYRFPTIDPIAAMGVQVIITSSSDEKLARAKQLGADHGINYKTTPDWDKAAVELTGGRGVDCVVEVGGAGTIARSFGSIRVGGKIGLIGDLSGPATELNPGMILAKRANVQGISVGSTQMFDAMNRAIAANKLKPAIDKVFGFDEVQAAYKHMASSAHFGKIVIRLA
jgi:NADPH:quinone reductase-like Zn-dependent oxidoreductase